MFFTVRKRTYFHLNISSCKGLIQWSHDMTIFWPDFSLSEEDSSSSSTSPTSSPSHINGAHTTINGNKSALNGNHEPLEPPSGAQIAPSVANKPEDTPTRGDDVTRGHQVNTYTERLSIPVKPINNNMPPNSSTPKHSKSYQFYASLHNVLGTMCKVQCLKKCWSWREGGGRSKPHFILCPMFRRHWFIYLYII